MGLGIGIRRLIFTLTISITAGSAWAQPSPEPSPPASPQPSPQPSGEPIPEPTFGVVPAEGGICEHVEFLNGSVVDPEFKPVYIFDQDSPTQSKCNDACAAEWPPILAPDFAPPLLAEVPPLNPALGGTPILRSDGKLQYIYGGHPLYTFSGDQTDEAGFLIGQPTGHCRSAHGGKWYLLKPDGTPCPCEAPPAPAPQPPPPAPPSPGGSCGPYVVCGWTPGWKCYSDSPYSRNHCNSGCCWYAGAEYECPGDNYCGGSGGCGYRCVYDVTDANCYSDCYGYDYCDFCYGGGGGGGCGPYVTCGWTPGWNCYSKSPGFRDHCNSGCCWNANDFSCPGDNSCG